MKPTECTLMNVEIGERYRHFGGVLNPLESEDFSRYFIILIDDETGKKLEQMGWDYAVRRHFKDSEDGPVSSALMVKIDYDICRPLVEVITETQRIQLEENRISCLDSANIDFANITVVQGGLFDESGKKVWTQAILKDLKVFSLETS